MSLWQNAMIRLARSQSLTRWMQGNPLMRTLASRFVGGENAAAAIAKARELKAKGLTASLFYLGEYVESRAMIEAMVVEITKLIPQAAQAGLDLFICVDPTQIGYSIADDLGEQNARCIARVFAEQPATGRKILMLDMEDFSYVQRTLDLQRRLMQTGCPTAITLQAYLYRSEQDIQDLLQRGVTAVRLVKGAFSESKDRAWTTRPEIDQNYVRLAARLLSPEAKAAGVYPIFATHDDRIIETIAGIARDNQWPPDAYEFEMLYGVRMNLYQPLLAAGHQLRLYLPYGTQWWPYTVRRIGEKSANARFVFTALVRR